ncbi:MAG: D-alanyl-D-alanine carboxypeptidase family protein [Gammaproteobacteria bacterium]|nr:D-alanyl-D-alanine carboxypeptidase family protein [Gammaproteobacteria bacterium]MDH4255058.1 D-alanyl-D-alanine carboxypeptidase family protein [Gammaproteobacteria bacterium]MDH5310942.1 D-alanyl-D-alanine carboxypeptidase family protein [Gammaproteobacteria bacterium]
MLTISQRRIHRELGIPAHYGAAGRPRFYAEASELVEIGPNVVGRVQRLAPRAAEGWRGMLEAAGSDGVKLLIVSGFRSFEYQAELIRKKLEAGQLIGDILTVNAAPGFSQHHTGTAIDLATPGSRPLTEEFETTEAFAWLAERAAGFGFGMSYPRDNPDGFIYEPWHWALM